MKTTTLAIAAAMAAGSLANSQTTWTVCEDGSCDFETIQEAVDAAADGDTVEIGPGTYTGSGTNVVDMVAKTVHLIGIAGPDSTIIDGENQRRGIYIQGNGSEAANIGGLTIRQCIAGTAPNSNRGAGLFLFDNASASVSRCAFRDNFAPYQGAAICVDRGSAATITECIFTGNAVGPPPFVTDWPGPVIPIRARGGNTPCLTDSSNGNVSRCLLVGNNAPSFGLFGSSAPVIFSHIYIADTALSARTVMLANYCDDSAALGMVTMSTIQLNSPLEYAAAIELSEGASGPGLAIGDSTFCGTYVDSAGIEGPWMNLGGNAFESACATQIGDAAAAQFDCNTNGLFDFFETVDGLATDVNRNGVPDTCECIADLTGNGEVDGADISIILGFWGKVPEPLPSAEINRDGLVDGLDLGVLLGSWGPCQ